jgi:hypothetical protein
LNYPPIFTFTFKVSNITLKPPQLSNYGNSTTLTFFSPKCPYHIFYFKKIPPPPPQRKKYAGVAGQPRYIYFLIKIKYLMVAFWGKKKEEEEGQNGRIATI